MKYRKKPIEIEAIQWDGENTTEILEFVGGNGFYQKLDVPHMVIYTLEGRMYAQVGSWIVKGIKGEFYPVRPDIFEASYEPAP